MFKKIDKKFTFILCMNIKIHTKCNCCMKHEFYLLNDVFYIKQQNVNNLIGLCCIQDLNNTFCISSLVALAFSPYHGIDIHILIKLTKRSLCV
jgi:hypothetical protein